MTRLPARPRPPIRVGVRLRVRRAAASSSPALLLEIGRRLGPADGRGSRAPAAPAPPESAWPRLLSSINGRAEYASGAGLGRKSTWRNETNATKPAQDAPAPIVMRNSRSYRLVSALCTAMF